MPRYRERLAPGPWAFIAWLLIIPAGLGVALPIDVVVGWIVAPLAYVIVVVILVASTPTLEVTATDFVAGKARLPLEFVGDTTIYRGEDAVLARGRELDARAYMLFRGNFPVVKVENIDPNDPTPYWLVSTRRPEDLVAALTKA